MTVRRYTEDEIAEFLFGTDVTGLNRPEVIEALNDWREHMEAGGYPVGTTDPAADAATELEKLREAVRGYLNGAPLDEHGRFTHPAREALYRAAGGR
jgi:hypothetical protein